MATPTHAAGMDAAPKPDLMSPDFLLAILTWVSFLSLLIILQKFAWKPILAGLQAREDYIRKSLSDADKAKADLAQVESTKVSILNEAKAEAAQIVDDARKTARTLAHDIEAKARQNAQDIIQNAGTQIDGERQRVREALQKESVNVAIALAGKILKENTDTDKNRRLVEEEIKRI